MAVHVCLLTSALRVQKRLRHSQSPFRLQKLCDVPLLLYGMRFHKSSTLSRVRTVDIIEFSMNSLGDALGSESSNERPFGFRIDLTMRSLESYSCRRWARMAPSQSELSHPSMSLFRVSKSQNSRLWLSLCMRMVRLVNVERKQRALRPIQVSCIRNVLMRYIGVRNH